MIPKPIALPAPPRVVATTKTLFESLGSPDLKLRGLRGRRDVLAFELELMEAELAAFESRCGGTDDTQDVELYDGTLGVSQAFVDDHQAPVGQLQWLDDLHTRFDSPGDVAGRRWGSGGLFADDLFLTAGHCFDSFGGGWQRPRRGGRTIEPAELARLMKINFGYQVDETTMQVRPGESFPVEALVEYRRGGLDYAIVKLGRNRHGQWPGQVHGTLKLASSDLVTAGAMLCMIQHPSGRPKRIEAGPMLSNVGGQMAYDSIDTEGGSSGSPILGAGLGQVVGVHTNGGCTAISGFNFGVAIGAIRAASSVLS